MTRVSVSTGSLLFPDNSPSAAFMLMMPSYLLFLSEALCVSHSCPLNYSKMMIRAFKAQQQHNGFMSRKKKKRIKICWLASFWAFGAFPDKRFMSNVPELTISQAHLCKNAVLFICGLTNLWPPQIQYKRGPRHLLRKQRKSRVAKVFLFFFSAEEFISIARL